MSRLTWKHGVMSLAVCIGGLLIVPAWSQDAKEPPKQGDGKGGDRRRGGPPGGFNLDEMQARMMGFFKERLKVDDEEWKVVEPRLKKVMTMGMQARGGGLSMLGRGRGPGGPGGPPGGDAGGPPQPPPDESEVGKASRAIRDLIEKDDAKPDQINAALETLRAARKKAQNELDAARKELRELLTLKQEATLVAMGILE